MGIGRSGNDLTDGVDTEIGIGRLGTFDPRKFDPLHGRTLRPRSDTSVP